MTSAYNLKKKSFCSAALTCDDVRLNFYQDQLNLLLETHEIFIMLLLKKTQDSGVVLKLYRALLFKGCMS